MRRVSAFVGAVARVIVRVWQGVERRSAPLVRLLVRVLGPVVRLLARVLGPVVRVVWRLVGPVVRPVLGLATRLARPVAAWAGPMLRGEVAPPPPPGLLWIPAVAAIALLAAGLATVAVSASAPPAPPFLRVASVAQVGDEVFDHDRRVLFVGAPDGRVRAFTTADGAVLARCDEDRIRGDGGQTWDGRGTPVDAPVALVELPVEVHDGQVYLDTSRVPPRPGGDAAAVDPCALPSAGR